MMTGGVPIRRPLLGLILIALASRAHAQAPEAGPRLARYVQAREIFQTDVGLTGTINRARVGVEGWLADGFSYKASVELASGGTATTQVAPSLRDAWVRWQRGGFGLTAGQFKTPFSRQFITALADVETADRAAVVDALAPKRDIGVMAAYEASGRATASLGVFNGEGQNLGANRDSSVLVVARLVAHPLQALTLGADIARYRDSTRYGLEAGAALAQFELKGEYIGEHRLGASGDDEGWYILAAYRARPWLQLVAQQEDFQRPSVVTFVENSATTLGVNAWFAGGKLRLLADYVSRKIGTRVGALITQIQVKF